MKIQKVNYILTDNIIDTIKNELKSLEFEIGSTTKESQNKLFTNNMQFEGMSKCTIPPKNENEIQAKVGITEVLRDQGGRLNRLSKVLGSNSILLEPTSFRHADGTTRYFFFNSNSVIDTIRSFIISKYKQRNFVDTIFFKDNIFIDGTSEIHEYVDHEALFTAKSKYPPKIYKKERENDWLIRNFKLGFLGTLFHEPEDSLKYIQQFWTN